MFTETEGSRKTIGDVDILFHDGLYHLFHLVLPNHDFIAHAVSTDGINWRRIRNALFIGDPGSFDDLMLWTMHVSPDPNREGGWRMFYTGLTRRDQGKIQRLGLALSDDLYEWRKYPVNWEDARGPRDPALVQAARKASARSEADGVHAEIDEASCFPLEPDPEYYEASLDEGRHWVSFRDPYFFHDGETGRLIAAGRVNDGPIVRRGCVAAFEETAPYCFSARPPLHHPMLYDDVEVPNLIEIEGQNYLIGSIREDAKIRYWHGSEGCEDWRSYHDNVLMPKGNYAGRVCRDEQGWLLWCFFVLGGDDRTNDNLMPPPKRFVRAENGQLYLKSHEIFDDFCQGAIDPGEVRLLKPESAGCHCKAEGQRWEISSGHAFQAFLFQTELESFRLRCRLRMDGKGKCGFVFRIDPETHDGYYLSLDLLKGVAQLRAWGTNHEADGEHMMNFKGLQAGYWSNESRGDEEISLLTFGSYIELSIGGRIVLSLADPNFDAGYVGFYLETASLTIDEIDLRKMENPQQFENHLVGA